MQSRKPVRHSFRLAASFLITAFLITLSAVTSAGISAAIPQPYLADHLLASGDLGVAPSFVSGDTIVRTPSGTLTGPDGVETFIAFLRNAYPDARFAVTDFRTVNSLIIVEWQGTADGTVVVPGRTLITVDDGRVETVTFLNLNGVAPLGPWGQPVETAEANQQLVIVDDHGNAVVPEASPASVTVAAAGLEAQGWPDFDPNSLADQAEAIDAAVIEAEAWPALDPSSFADRVKAIDAAAVEARAWPALDPTAIVS